MARLLRLLQGPLQMTGKDRRDMESELNELRRNISRKTWSVFHGGYITYLSTTLSH
jgi:hypothetical protein